MVAKAETGEGNQNDKRHTKADLFMCLSCDEVDTYCRNGRNSKPVAIATYFCSKEVSGLQTYVQSRTNKQFERCRLSKVAR